MKRLNHSKTLIKPLLIAAGLVTAVAAPAWAAELPDGVVNNAGHAVTDAAVDPESVAHANWRAGMAQIPKPGKGCFHASYPEFVWESVDVSTGVILTHCT